MIARDNNNKKKELFLVVEQGPFQIPQASGLCLHGGTAPDALTSVEAPGVGLEDGARSAVHALSRDSCRTSHVPAAQWLMWGSTGFACSRRLYRAGEEAHLYVPG